MDVFSARHNAWASAMTRETEAAGTPFQEGRPPGEPSICSENNECCSSCGSARSDSDHQRFEWAQTVAGASGNSPYWRAAIAAEAYFAPSLGNDGPNLDSRISILMKQLQMAASELASRDPEMPWASLGSADRSSKRRPRHSSGLALIGCMGQIVLGDGGALLCAAPEEKPKPKPKDVVRRTFAHWEFVIIGDEADTNPDHYAPIPDASKGITVDRGGSITKDGAPTKSGKYDKNGNDIMIPGQKLSPQQLADGIIAISMYVVETTYTEGNTIHIDTDFLTVILVKPPVGYSKWRETLLRLLNEWRPSVVYFVGHNGGPVPGKVRAREFDWKEIHDIVPDIVVYACIYNSAQDAGIIAETWHPVSPNNIVAAECSLDKGNVFVAYLLSYPSIAVGIEQWNYHNTEGSGFPNFAAPGRR